MIIKCEFHTTTVSTGMCPPNVLKPIFLGAFSLCSDQVSEVLHGLCPVQLI